MGRTQVFDWFRRFREGRTSAESDPRSGQPSKVMLLAFFYLEVSRRLHESVRQKRPEKWREGDWIPHHDNVPAHTSHLVQQFLAKHGNAQLQQPPYSPELAPCDFFLTPRFKKVLKGH